MKKRDYTMAAYASIVNAVLTLPILFISLFMLIGSGGEYSFISSILSLIQAGLIVFMYLSFKELLNESFDYREINTFIDILIVSTVIVTLIDLFPLEGSLLITIIVVIMGIVKVIAFVKLLNIKDDLYGHLKPLAYTSIATGIMIASVLFIFFAFIPSIISDIVLGMIFFKASR